MELFPLKAYSTKCSLQSLQIMVCLDLDGVSAGVYAVSDSCDTCNKVITLKIEHVATALQSRLCGCKQSVLYDGGTGRCRKCRHHLGRNDFQYAFFTLFCFKIPKHHEDV